MKNTPFTDKHIALGAKMLEFAGFNMPVEYTGIIDEHLAVLNSVGVFDVSHMGELWIKGPRAFNFLQRIVSNDISVLEIGKAQYSCLINEKGGVVDDVILYYYEAEKYMMVVNASNIEKDFKWLKKNNTEGAELQNASEEIGLLAVQGPSAIKVLQKLTDVDLETIKPFNFFVGSLKNAGMQTVIISNTGYTGAGGFEIYFFKDQAEKIWDLLFEAGKEYDIKPIGLGARDTLRLEMGYCLYGHELSDDITPLEAGLGWATKFVDGKNFIARDILEKQKIEGVKRKLSAFVLLEKGIPRAGYEIVDANGNIIGAVTSGTMSPLLKKGIGLGYISKENSAIGNEIFIRIRNKDIKAKIIKLPFRGKEFK